MRETKFRGKREDNGELIYGDLCFYDFLAFIGVAKTISEIRKGVWVPSVIWYEVIPESVGGYTGLNDSKRTKKFPKGQEIYEGDIFDSPSKNKFYVLWWKDGWYYNNVKDAHRSISGRLSEVAQDWKIIGNIYENIELIIELINN